MAKTIAFANQKGGVGKTTSAVHVAGALALDGYRVLLVDSDPQANATDSIGVARDGNTLLECYEAAMDSRRAHELSATVEQAINRHAEKWDVLPAKLDLAAIEPVLTGAMKREEQLRKMLKAVEKNYDFIIVDCPPSFGLLTLNALCAADGIVVVLQPEAFSVQGYGMITETVDLIRANIRDDIRILGMAITMYDARLRIHREFLEGLKAEYGELVFDPPIRYRTKVKEAQAAKQTIFDFDGTADVGRDYLKLTDNIRSRTNE